jgi:hypothetical protein
MLSGPCDPLWLIKPSCTTFTETKTVIVDLAGKPATGDFGWGFVTINVTRSNMLCLVGEQHGGLAYTLTLLPDEKMTICQSDRYHRTTSETKRYSVQTTFTQLASSLYQQRNANDTSKLIQVSNNQTQSSSASGGGGINLGVFSLSGGGASSSSSSSGSAADFATIVAARSPKEIERAKRREYNLKIMKGEDGE